MPRPVNRSLIALITVALATVLGSATAVATPDDSDDTITDDTVIDGTPPLDEDAEEAARLIAEARARANQAADDFFAAQSELDLLELDRQRLEADVADLEQLVDDIEQAVRQVAVDRYVASGSSGIPVLTDIREPTEQLQGDTYAALAAEAGSLSIDDYEEAQARLERAREALLDAEDRLRDKQDDLTELQATAENEVERLRAVEEVRLQDEAVRQALDAQQAEEARELAEIEQFEAERERAEAERAEAQPVPGFDPAATNLPATNSPFDPSATIPVGSVPATLPDGSPVPITAVPGSPLSDPNATSTGGITTGNAGRSGGAVGGRTGGGGIGTTPHLIDGIVCPVGGASAYGDTWGAPRSGGRRHQGVDMLAPTGTPLLAVVSGIVTQKANTLGGVTISLQGDNGNRYYYAHLSAYEGVGGQVAQGQVIGYVGDTGNATGVPHLHFEIRPGGGVPVNPYPSVRGAGC